MVFGGMKGSDTVGTIYGAVFSSIEINSPFARARVKKYFEKSAFKADREPRGKFREIRDAIKDDWHDVPRGSHYQGEDVRVFPEKEKAKQDAHDYLKSGGDMFDIAGAL